jgi:acetyl-CoA C-acetyltransferase
MTDVFITGIGQMQVGEHWDLSLREMAFHAIQAALQDAGDVRPEAVYVANMLAPTLSRQSHLATLVADFAGLIGIEALTVESAGASGGAALRQAFLAVRSGDVKTALVVGVEKITDKVGPVQVSALSAAGDGDYESEHGLTPSAQAALLMQRYLYEFEADRQGFAGFPLTAHANGAHNPHAMFQRAIKPALYERAGMVSDPLNMFDVAPAADGAAAVVVSSEPAAVGAEAHAVRIAGSSLVTDTLALHDRPDPLDFRAARLSVERALNAAGLDREAIDLFELHDAFSIFSALSLEAAGFSERGQGWRMAENGGISTSGQLPLTTMGGLKARGNPGGATGVYQAVEATLQLRGDAGENQVKAAKCALIQCMGGPASSVASHVLVGD